MTTIRPAREADLPAILQLFSADPVSSARSGHSSEPSEALRSAFHAIDASSDHALWVWAEDGEVLGTYQISFVPGLSRNGMWRAMVESVHVRADMRNRGLGAKMMQHAIDQARERGCGLLQLTTDKRRSDAHRFYLRLGFVASHEGMKLDLSAG